MHGGAVSASLLRFRGHGSDAVDSPSRPRLRLIQPEQAPLDRDSDDAFLDFASKVIPSSYSQRFQDLFGLWESDFATGGYFVEFVVIIYSFRDRSPRVPAGDG